MSPSASPLPDRLGTAAVSATGFFALLLGSGLLPLGVNTVQTVTLAILLTLGAGVRAWLTLSRRSESSRPLSALHVLTLVAALSVTALDPLAGGLTAGLCWWTWFGRMWPGAQVLAGASVLCWMRSVTGWPDSIAGIAMKPFTLALGSDSLSAGPTALAAWPLAIAAALLWRATVGAARTRWIAIVGFLTIATAHVFQLNSTLLTVAETRVAADLFAPLSITSGILIAWVAAITAMTPMQPQIAASPRLSRVLAVALALLFVPLATWYLPPANAPTHVAFLNEGGLDWHRAQRGTPMGFGFGMFGETPFYLEQDGMKTSVLSGDELTNDESLRDVDILVTINNPRIWSAADHQQIDAFLRGGGSLLVLGDHTDVFGCKKGFDSLLAPYGMTFRFDSAYHAWSSWAGSGFPTHHPATCLSEEAPFSMGHGIGASLALDAGVEPLFVGRFAFSDIGVRENQMGSFLGNYSYDQGEMFGDVALAAWTQVGAGRILVYGDTSAYQSGGIRFAYRSHVLPMMRWLASPSGWAESAAYRLVLTCLLLLAVGLSVGSSGRSVAATALAGALACVLVPILARTQAPIRTSLEDKVLVDESLGPFTGHYDTQMNATGPAYASLSRAGILSIDGHDLARDLKRNPRGVLLIAPTREFHPQETEEMLAYMSRGGHVLIAAGIESRRALSPLLAKLDLDIAPIPLGVVPPKNLSGPARLEPRTRNGWPITVGESALSLTEDLFAHGPHRVAVHRRVGSGGLVLIGDGRFLSGVNVETLWTVWPGNVRFLNKLFQRIFGATSDANAERFESPEKPN